MKLILVSNPGYLSGEAELINSLFKAGLQYLHLRKPEFSKSQYENLLTEIEPTFRSRIAVHQHHAYGKEMGIKRLHFPENERKTKSAFEINQLVDQGYILSTSIHDLHEIMNLSKRFSYTFYGPVFDSISKTGYAGVLQSDFILENVLKKIPVIGLGGIHSKNLSLALKMNFDGLAISGALWKDPSRAVENFILIKKVLNSDHDQ